MSPDPVRLPEWHQTFDSAMAPLRAAHRRTLRDLAEWSFAAGVRYEVSTAALCLDALERHCRDEGEPLDRPGVTSIVCGQLPSRAMAATTCLPETWMSDLWTVLRFLITTERLVRVDDSVEALFEPLQCFGGLDEFGRPRPAGVDPGFPCRCFLPHAQVRPSGMAQQSASHECGDDRLRDLVQVHAVARSGYSPVSEFSS